MQINYLKGDATVPAGDGPKVIVHICNDVGAWGKGFVLAISKRWPTAERDYRKWHAEGALAPVQTRDNSADHRRDEDRPLGDGARGGQSEAG